MVTVNMTNLGGLPKPARGYCRVRVAPGDQRQAPRLEAVLPAFHRFRPCAARSADAGGLVEREKGKREQCLRWACFSSEPDTTCRSKPRDVFPVRSVRSSQCEGSAQAGTQLHPRTLPIARPPRRNPVSAIISSTALQVMKPAAVAARGRTSVCAITHVAVFKCCANPSM